MDLPTKFTLGFIIFLGSMIGLVSSKAAGLRLGVETGLTFSLFMGVVLVIVRILDRKGKL